MIRAAFVVRAQFWGQLNPLLNPSAISGKAARKSKNPQTLENQWFAGGAGNVTRTHDLLITNQLLYRLSYTSTLLYSRN